MEVPLGEAVGRVRDQDAPALGGLLEASRDVGGVTDRCVIHAQVGADAADDHETGVHALPDLEADATPTPQLFFIGAEDGSDAEGGVQGSAGVVFVGDGGTEERHDAITEELVYGTLVAVDFGEHQLESACHEAVDILWVKAF